MKAFTTETLEFDRFADLLSSYATSGPGAGKVLGVGPEPDQRLSGRVQSLLPDGLNLLRSKVELPAVRFQQLDDQLARVTPEGAVLLPEDFLLIREVLECGDRVRKFLCGERCESLTSLSNFGNEIPTFNDLCRHIDGVFAEDGSIMDRASPKLAQIRAEISRSERQIRGRLERLIADSALEGVIQDNYVAMRNSRFVVPIRRENRSQIRGVVHDQSNSGRTLFVEPEGVVEQSNELSSAKLEERDEIRRILRKLSDHVRSVSGEFSRLTRDLIDYDCARAICRWGNDYECILPQWGDTLNLKNGRHPLLQEQFRREGKEDDLVPLSLSLNDLTRVVVISGSNTGGKTVVLKTIGLLQMMAQTGLPIPADNGTAFPKIKAILADIGDEQSIQESLSTFSSHLTHVRDILEISKTTQSLILLDELGSGTDPAEGSALGAAVLHSLLSGSNLTFATTHLAAIKHYAHETDGMINAAVLFNKKTLRPEYQLELGRPGASHAMTIARSLGIQDAVLTKAEEFLNSDELKLEKLLAQMDAEQQELHRNLRTSERARKAIETKQKILTEELDELKRERKKILNRAQREAAAIVDNSKREMDLLIRKAGKNLDKSEASKLREQAGSKQKALNQNIDETRERPREPVDISKLTVGDRVWVASLNDHGTIESISGNRKRVKITVSGMPFDVKSRDLGQPDPEDNESERPASVAVSKPKNATAGKTELKLLGFRVEEGVKELEKFLDSAALSGLLQVRIVHGFGTGAMLTAVHEYLAACPLIKSFRRGRPEKDEGGAGVTWVELK